MSKIHDYKGYRIEVYVDEDPMNPRDHENLGKMVCGHRRYLLGDTQINDYNHIINFLKTVEKDGAVTLPLYLYDHSGITMNTTGFACPWDSGWVGFIYASKEEIRRQMGWKNITKKRREIVEQWLVDEVEEYDQYLRGDVYGFEVTHDRWDVPEGYGGCPSPEYALEEGKAIVDRVLQLQEEGYE
jgi:hypothetical protein